MEIKQVDKMETKNKKRIGLRIDNNIGISKLHSVHLVIAFSILILVAGLVLLYVITPLAILVTLVSSLVTTIFLIKKFGTRFSYTGKYAN